MLWICDILVRIRIRTTDFRIRILLLLSGLFFAYYYLKSKEVTKYQTRFFLLFLLVHEGSGSGSVQNNDGSGSWRPQKHTDPEHHKKVIKFVVHNSHTDLRSRTAVLFMLLLFYIQPSFKRGSGVDPDPDEMKSRKSRSRNSQNIRP